jgi:hypothetical protein
MLTGNGHDGTHRYPLIIESRDRSDVVNLPHTFSLKRRSTSALAHLCYLLACPGTHPVRLRRRSIAAPTIHNSAATTSTLAAKNTA